MPVPDTKILTIIMSKDNYPARLQTPPIDKEKEITYCRYLLHPSNAVRASQPGYT